MKVFGFVKKMKPNCPPFREVQQFCTPTASAGVSAVPRLQRHLRSAARIWAVLAGGHLNQAFICTSMVTSGSVFPCFLFAYHLFIFWGELYAKFYH